MYYGGQHMSQQHAAYNSYGQSWGGQGQQHQFSAPPPQLPPQQQQQQQQQSQQQDQQQRQQQQQQRYESKSQDYSKKS